MKFQSPSYGLLEFDQMISRIQSYVANGQRHQHKIILGTDSAPPLGSRAEFVTALVVHRVGRGGIYFWRRATQEKIVTLRDRMYHEALLSLELARKLVDDGLLAFGAVGSDWLEIHVDIGENGPTRQMIKEIVGMVTGSGFRVKTKPASYAASKVADRYT